MSSLLLGSISATLGLDNSGFNRGILQSQALTTTFGNTITTVITNPLLAGIGAMKTFGAVTVAALSAAAKAMAELAGKAEELDNLNKRTGMATDMLQAFDLMMRDAGERAGAFYGEVDTMARKLGDADTDGGRTVAQLAKLGLTIEQLMALNPDERFVLLGKRIQELKDPFQRAAYAADFFGRSMGSRVINTIDFGSESIKRFIKENKELGTIMDDSVVQAGIKVDNAIDGVGNAVDGLYDKLAGAALEGFAAGMGKAGDGAKEASQVIAQTLVPAVKAVAFEVGELARNLDMVLMASREIKATGFQFMAGATSVVSPSGAAGWQQAAMAESAIAAARRAERASTGRGK